MKTPRIYLSGPIAGLTYSEATDWRDYVGGILHRAGIEPLDPLRQKTFKTDDVRVTSLNISEVVSAVDDAMLTDRGITSRDYHDTVTSDVVLVNLLGASRVSIGTVIEIAWAHEQRPRIPVVLAIEAKGNLHDHPMLREMVSFRVDSLDRAINVALSTLNMGAV